MIPVTVDHVRLYLHVLAATVWVGGQLTLAGLVPGLRAIDADAPRAVARRFNRIAWPAFAVLVVTGLWNIAEIDVTNRSTEYQVTLFVKILVVALSGVAAFSHSRAASKVTLAVWGAVSGAAALGALFLGVQLHG